MDFLADDVTYKARLVRLTLAPPVQDAGHRMRSAAESEDLQDVEVRLHGRWLAVRETGDQTPDLYPFHRVIEVRGVSAGEPTAY